MWIMSRYFSLPTLLLAVAISSLASAQDPPAACSVLRAARDPRPACQGPFMLLPAPGFDKCTYEGRQEAAVACLNQCVQDSCCRSVGLAEVAGGGTECRTSVAYTSALHYTKQQPCAACGSHSVCGSQFLASSCRAVHKLSTLYERWNFDFYTQFRSTLRDPQRITVFVENEFGVLSGLEFDYGSGVVGNHWSGYPSTVHDCLLVSGEYVTAVTTYETVQWGYTIQGGILLTTNHKVCGPYGRVTSTQHSASGGRLLYAYGWFGRWMDDFWVVFDVCGIL